MSLVGLETQVQDVVVGVVLVAAVAADVAYRKRLAR
jgi:ABC-type xylose transport system permease subunit